MRLLLLISIFLLTPVLSFAQSLTDVGPSLLLDPMYPAPGEEVSITIDNYLSNLYSAEITWYANGVEIPNTKNQRDITLQAGKVNSKTLIETRLAITGLGVQIVQANINPLYLDVIVEPQTHVPDFYEGRSLPSTGSVTNLIALISDKNLSSNNLVYTWRVNNSVLGGGGGRGQNRVSFDTPQGSRVIISLNVSTLAGKTIASRSFTIPSVSPKLFFYELNTLYGLSYLPLSSFNLISNSATIVAEPFYLDSRVYNNPDIKTWSIDNNEINTSGNPYELTFERVDYNGNAKLGFHVRSTTNLLQGTRGNLNVNY